jgi:hypothetical protein
MTAKHNNAHGSKFSFADERWPGIWAACYCIPGTKWSCKFIVFKVTATRISQWMRDGEMALTSDNEVVWPPTSKQLESDWVEK